MKISRYFQEESFEIGQVIELSKENHRHAVQVLRSEVASPLIMFNGEGGEYKARFVDIKKHHSWVKIESFNPQNRESALKITLVLAMIKPDKMDFAIQKAVELGVNVIQPIYTQRSVIRLKSNRLEKKMAHWQAVIVSASEQSGRTSLAEILPPIDFALWLKQVPPGSLSVAMLPGNHPGMTKLAESSSIVAACREVLLVIGPEGGFSDAEEQQIVSANINPVSFGPRILRAETAVVAGISACQLCWGDL